MSQAPLAVLVGRFAPVIAHGLRAVLRNDPTIRLIEDGLDATRLETAVQRHRPAVAIIDESAAITADLPKRLRQRHAELGILVLAASPSRAYAMGLVSRG